MVFTCLFTFLKRLLCQAKNLGLLISGWIITDIGSTRNIYFAVALLQTQMDSNHLHLTSVTSVLWNNIH